MHYIFIFQKIDKLYHANSPDQPGELNIELLHWKDGRVRLDVNGESSLEMRNDQKKWI